jgi:4-amino-4-deoxy-L-arabinose transferase-like glycosyltransferase
MEFFKKLFLNTNVLVVLAVLLAAILRLLWLDKVPGGVGGDELTYIITTKFMSVWWSDLLHTWNPFSIFVFHYPHEFQAEISYFLLYPFLKFLPLSLISAKIPFVILSIATVFVVYLVANELFDKKTAVIAGFLMAINPWSIFIGRTAYEMVPEAFFEVVAIYALLKLKGWNILWSVPLLALVFYSHIAVKIIFVPFVLVILLYVYFKNKKRYLKQYLIVGAFSVFLTLFFAISVKTNPDFPRTSEILSFNNPAVIKSVDSLRKSTIPNYLNYIFDNKITTVGNILTAKFFKTLSFDYLFSTGDAFYGIYSHGLFYVVDAFFLVIGMFYAFIKKRKQFYFLIVLPFFAIVPHLLHTASLENFTPQITLLFPIFIIFISFGIKNISELFKSKILLIIICIIYTISLLNFLQIYFYQFPLKETFDFKVRVLSNYVKRAPQNTRIIVYSPTSEDYFKKYIFYTNSINKKTASSISSDIKEKRYSLENVTFTDCNKPDFSKNVIIIDSSCKDYGQGHPHVSISRLIDGGAGFSIYNDDVCSKFSLDYYASNITLSDFSVEKLSLDTFCKTYITK